MARIRELPDLPAPASTARIPIDPAGVGGTGSVSVADFFGAANPAVRVAVLDDDDTLPDQSEALQEQIDACETDGICELIIPPYKIWAPSIVISHPLHFRGTGVKVGMNNLADGLPSDFGTRIVMKEGDTDPAISIVSGANGAMISGVCFLQPDQTADGPGFAPDDTYAPCILNTSAWTRIARNCFWGLNQAIQFGETVGGPGSGYCTVEDNTFACFDWDVHVFKAGDWNLFQNNFHHGWFVQNKTYWRDWIQTHARAYYLGRCDHQAIIGNNVFGYKAMVETYENGDFPPNEGFATRLRISDNDGDKVWKGMTFNAGTFGGGSGNRIVGTVSDLTPTLSGLTGSYAIQTEDTADFKFTETATQRHNEFAMVALNTSRLALVNTRIDEPNCDAGGHPASYADTSATVVIGLDYEVTNSSGGPETGGPGTFIRTATLAGTETLTNKTLTNPAISGGGSLAGTFSGNPTLSGGVSFGGAPRPSANDGAALGTTALQWSDLFLANGGVINWNNGGATITYASADGSMTYAGASVHYFTTTVRPFTNDAGSLGSGALSWSDLFLASGAVINFNNGDVTLTHSADTLTVAGGTLVLPASGLQVGSSNPFSDSAGTLTLQNVDALDATTEATIEAAIDTLPNAAGVAVHGTNTNDSAAAGYVGEYTSQQRDVGSAASLTSATDTNVTASALSLTAGDWDVWGQIDFIPAATTTVVYCLASISESSATRDQATGFQVVDFYNGATVGSSVTPVSIKVGPVRKSFASTTSVYLVARSQFSVSTMTMYGKLQARRAR